MLFVIMKAVNQNKEFRMSFNEKGELGYWDKVVPCYTLFHNENKTFTDIWSEYDEDFNIFYRTVIEDIHTRKVVFCFLLLNSENILRAMEIYSFLSPSLLAMQ